MKKILITIITTIIFLSLTACGDSGLTGTWYDTTYPDDELILTQDKVFSYKDASGEWSVEEDILILSESSGWYDSEQMTISQYEGEKALIESDGTVWIKNYDKAVQIYEALEAEKEAQRKAEKEAEEQAKYDENAQLINVIKENLYGDYIGVTPIGEADTLIIDEDNTYEYKSGRYDNHTQNGKFILSEDYDKGVIKVEFAPSSATQEYIEYEGGNNPFLAEAYFTLDERVTADGRENCVVVKGSGGINRCDTFYRDIN